MSTRTITKTKEKVIKMLEEFYKYKIDYNVDINIIKYNLIKNRGKSSIFFE